VTRLFIVGANDGDSHEGCLSDWSNGGLYLSVTHTKLSQLCRSVLPWGCGGFLTPQRVGNGSLRECRGRNFLRASPAEPCMVWHRPRWGTVFAQIREQILLVTSLLSGTSGQMSDFNQYGGCMLKRKLVDDSTSPRRTLFVALSGSNRAGRPAPAAAAGFTSVNVMLRTNPVASIGLSDD
jgi:hypothetical protein